MSEKRTEIGMSVFVITALYSFLFFKMEHAFDSAFRMTDFTYSFAEARFGSISEGSFWRPIAYITVGLTSMPLLFLGKRKDFELKSALFLLTIFFVAWTFLSYFWSDDPQLVLKRSVAFVAILAASFAFSHRYSINSFLAMVLAVTMIYLFTGLLTEIKIGTFGFDLYHLHPFSEGYRFTGTMHPEGQAFNCGMLFLTSLVFFDSKKSKSKIFFLLIAFLGFYFLILTRSRGPFAGVILAVIIYVLLTRRRSKTATMLYSSLFGLSIAILLVGGAAWRFVVRVLLLGRQDQVETLTGRVPLWTECWEYVARRPLTGYGFGGFWTENRAWDFLTSQDWLITSAHSVFIDIALSLGLLGFFTFLGILLISWKNGLKICLQTRDRFFALIVGVLGLICVDSLLSSHVILSGFATFVLFSIVFYLGFTRVTLTASAEADVPSPRPKTGDHADSTGEGTGNRPDGFSQKLDPDRRR
jgi:O-antigen ligase